jgi:hypothetical protein
MQEVQADFTKLDENVLCAGGFYLCFSIFKDKIHCFPVRRGSGRK